MWVYEKKLEYPVKIKNGNPKMAKYVITQYGGPDGELAASLRYLSQRFAMPTEVAKATLNDIGTEELAHLEMVGSIVYQLCRGVPAKVLEKEGLGAYYADHDHAVYPISASGHPFTAAYIQSKGDPIADLHEDLAAEQKARATYENLIRLSDDPDVIDPLRFLREREIVHFQRFGEALRIVQDTLAQKKFFMQQPNAELFKGTSPAANVLPAQKGAGVSPSEMPQKKGAGVSPAEMKGYGVSPAANVLPNQKGAGVSPFEMPQQKGAGVSPTEMKGYGISPAANVLPSQKGAGVSPYEMPQQKPAGVSPFEMPPQKPAGVSPFESMMPNQKGAGVSPFEMPQQKGAGVSPAEMKGYGISPAANVLPSQKGAGVSPFEMPPQKGAGVSPMEMPPQKPAGVSPFEMPPQKGAGVSPIEKKK